MPTRQEATLLFERRRDAWLRGDLDAYLALWAEDMTFQSPLHAEPPRGRAAFADLVRRSFVFSRPLAFDFTHIAVAGDMVLAEWRIAVERRAGRWRRGVRARGGGAGARLARLRAGAHLGAPGRRRADPRLRSPRRIHRADRGGSRLQRRARGGGAARPARGVSPAARRRGA